VLDVANAQLPRVRRPRILGGERSKVLSNLVQAHGAAGSGTLGRGIGEFESLFHLELGPAFDFEDAAGDRGKR
jgi:hypothetical protein